MIDRAAILALSAKFPSEDLFPIVIAHEIGHLLGLSHTYETKSYYGLPPALDPRTIPLDRYYSSATGGLFVWLAFHTETEPPPSGGSTLSYAVDELVVNNLGALLGLTAEYLLPPMLDPAVSASKGLFSHVLSAPVADTNGLVTILACHSHAGKLDLMNWTPRTDVTSMSSYGLTPTEAALLYVRRKQ